jgi:hypothetical protein
MSDVVTQIAPPVDVYLVAVHTQMRITLMFANEAIIIYSKLMHGCVIVLKCQLIPSLVSQLISSITSQPASQRRGRALNATNNIAQALELSSF